MANVPNAVEILSKILTAGVGRTSVTDKTTEGQTAGRATANSDDRENGHVAYGTSYY